MTDPTRQEKMREHARNYYHRHKEERAEYGRKWSRSERGKQYKRDYRQKNKEKLRKQEQDRFKIPEVHMRRSEQNKKRYAREKMIVLSHYSNGDIKCVCCGERNLAFLSVDHINNDGHIERKIRKMQFYKSIIDNNFPESLRILCINCNFARSNQPDHVCPHIRRFTKEELQGKLIIIEGIDASGKTVQTKMLWEQLKKTIGAVKFEFPNYDNKTGVYIKHVIKGKISYHSETWAQLLAANRSEDRALIESSLRYTNVVCNRYTVSNLAYSSASGISSEWLTNLDAKMPQPDIVIILDIPVQTSKDRKSKRDPIESDLLYLEKVRKQYLYFAEQLGWHVVDGTKSPQEVHNDILNIVNKQIPVEPIKRIPSLSPNDG